ncbi:outer membrane protein assembly factor BamC [Trinickia dinghuensis]|uniref:Outer membrane protein assembly factor BamC n=1 Tax=Trinickia dinghuensis TaxID=2291023 RepID=A0A3D8JYF2_9BURK|nr:outer membrane protein assembly factor BamC [Trinickia dinghuensis]RDU97391.1 outer membrane protein assembly factor BamC [Trinickia dinghuensis]
MTDLRFTSRLAALILAGGLVAGCSTPSPTKIDYKSDSKSKQASLAVPPNLLDETADQRSLPPQGGETSASTLAQVQKAAPSENNVMPPVKGMHIQRDGTESWLVIDNRTPDEVWPRVRRFWQEQGFLLVVDQRDKHVLETDWNETRPQINLGLIRGTISKAMGNAYVAAERNKYRTRLESAPNGGTYVFISQKGMHEELESTNSDTTKWVAKPNDPALELEYLKRLMAGLALADARGSDTAGPVAADIAPNGASDAAAAKAGKPDANAAAIAARNATMSAQAQDAAQGAGAATGGQYTSTELTLDESYDQAWERVGLALDRSNFTVDDRDRTKGLYQIRYVDPKDKSSEEQGFWSQVFHGRKEKVAKQYYINVKAVTENQTRVAVVNDKGDVESSQPAKEIMSMLVDQLH